MFDFLFGLAFFGLIVFGMILYREIKVIREFHCLRRALIEKRPLETYMCKERLRGLGVSEEEINRVIKGYG